MTEQQPVKHIDTANLPTDQLKAAWDLILAKQFSDLTLYANLLYVASWAILWLKSRREGPVVFGETPEEAEFCELAGNVVDWADGNEVRPRGSAIGAWLVKAMVIALVNRLIRELAKNGSLPDWLLKIIERLKEQIEAL
jgi:hypothetical protein